jgi:hypothetical protein
MGDWAAPDRDAAPARAPAAPSDFTLLAAYAIFAVLFVVVAVVFYSMPTFVAAWRGHPSVWEICALNLLSGWSLVGWGIAMAWACGPIRPSQAVHDVERPPRHPARDHAGPDDPYRDEYFN